MTEAEITSVKSELAVFYPNETDEQLRNRAIASISAVQKVFDGLVRTIVAGDNCTITPDRENKTITVAGGGGGGHTIIDENGSPMVQQDNLQFTGGVEVTDNGSTTTTVNVHEKIARYVKRQYFKNL